MGEAERLRHSRLSVFLRANEVEDHHLGLYDMGSKSPVALIVRRTDIVAGSIRACIPSSHDSKKVRHGNTRIQT